MNDVPRAVKFVQVLALLAAGLVQGEEQAGVVRSHLHALGNLAAELEQNGEVLRAADRYALLMSRNEPHLTAAVSVNSGKRTFVVNDMDSFWIKVALRPFQCERYEWHIVSVHVRPEEPTCTVQRAASGVSQHNSLVEMDVSVPTDKIGEYQLRLLVFGHPLPEGKSDFLDSTTIPYCVRPMINR